MTSGRLYSPIGGRLGRISSYALYTLQHLAPRWLGQGATPRVQVVALLTACCLITVLACLGCAPSSIPNAGIADCAQPSPKAGGKPVRLAFRLTGSQQLRYTLTTGIETAKGTYREYQRVHYILTEPSSGRDGHAVAEYSRAGGEQFLAGDWRPFIDLGEMRVVFHVDPQGVVRDIVAVEASDELTEWTRVLLYEPLLGTYVVGFPPADVTLGILNTCVLPETPVAVGSRWARDITIPYTKGPLPPIRFEGELTRLEDKEQDTHAIIQSQIAIPGVQPAYVAEVTFSVTWGRVVSVEWQALPGAPKGTFRWLSLDAS